MDSASINALLTSSNKRLDQQEANLTATGQAVHTLVARVAELTQQMQQLVGPTVPDPPPIPHTPSTSRQPEPRLPTPESYAGESNYCRAFLTKCSLFFALQPQTFNTERSKVAFVLTLLSGRAALWGTAVWENQHPCCSSFQTLAAEMRRVFDRAVTGREAARQLAELRQGNRSVSDYSIEFRTLAAECKWNEEAQWDMFLHGLADRIQKEIFAIDLPEKIDGLIDLALRVDARLSRLRSRMEPQHGSVECPQASATDAVSYTVDPEPMQVGRARLSREEKARWRSRGLCLYCGGNGHLLDSCPVKDHARR